MRALAVVSTLSLASALWAGGFDDMALWPYELPGLTPGCFSHEPSVVCSPGLNTAFLHTNPYGISSLHWDFSGVNYGFGRFGIRGSYQSYGLDALYEETRAVLGMAFMTNRRAAVAISLAYDREEFDRAASYSWLDAGLNLSFSQDGLTAQLKLDHVNLKKPSRYSGETKPETMASLSFRPDTNIVFSAGVKGTTYGRDRWFLCQSMTMVDGVGLRLGYMTSPNLLSGGLDFSWKSVTLVLTYLAVSKLNDCVVLGISFRT